MHRNVENRYENLPKRTASMLKQIVQKFYRGATQHYPFIQEKKGEVLQAVSIAEKSGDSSAVTKSIAILFGEFHFYVTCWLQIELALYRLTTQTDEAHRYLDILHNYREVLDLHLHVRDCLENTEEYLDSMWQHVGSDLSFVHDDKYWFKGRSFSVDEESIRNLHRLYKEIMSV